MGGFPTPIVEIAFTTDPLSSSPAWTDVTADCLGFDPKAGRNHERGVVEAGDCVIILDNTTRKYDPTNTASPYYPNIVPGRRCRIRATYNAITYPIFDGYIDSWPPKYTSVATSETHVRAVDAFGLFAREALTTYTAEVLADAPVAYWRLYDEFGTLVAIDDAGDNDGAYLEDGAGISDGPYGSTAPNVAVFDAVGVSVAGPPDALKITGDLTFEAWIYPTENALSMAIIDLGAPGRLWWQFGGSFAFDDRDVDPDIGYASYAGGSAPLNGWTHLAVTRSAAGVQFYIDGVPVGELGLSGRTIADTPFDVGVARSEQADAVGNWIGRLAHVAVYDKALSVGRIRAHFDARMDELDAQLSGAVVSQILDRIGWPAALRAVDAGSSVIQRHLPAASALEEFRAVARAENGLFFMGPDGTASFHSRAAIFTTPHNVPQATFGDDLALNELPYREHEPTFDDQDLWTAVRAGRRGGLEVTVVADTTTINRYGRRTLEDTDLLLDNDAEVVDRANYWLDRYKTPRLRIPGVALDGADDDDLWPQILGRSFHFDRITLKRRPPGGGPTIVQESHIEGVSHTVRAPFTWRTQWALTPADPLDYWILGDATFGVLGTTSRLAY